VYTHCSRDCSPESLHLAQRFFHLSSQLYHTCMRCSKQVQGPEQVRHTDSTTAAACNVSVTLRPKLFELNGAWSCEWMRVGGRGGGDRALRVVEKGVQTECLWSHGKSSIWSRLCHCERIILTAAAHPLVLCNVSQGRRKTVGVMRGTLL
jgi:hypothetical protein